MYARLDVGVPGHQRIQLPPLLDHRLWPGIWAILSKEKSFYVIPFVSSTDTKEWCRVKEMQMLSEDKAYEGEGEVLEIEGLEKGPGQS